MRARTALKEFENRATYLFVLLQHLVARDNFLAAVGHDSHEEPARLCNGRVVSQADGRGRRERGEGLRRR